MFGWTDHVGELELWVQAPRPEDVFAEGVRAVGELLGEEDGTVPGEPTERELEVDGEDRPRLFADWLGELAFLAEMEGFVPDHARGVQLKEGRVHGWVSGHLGSPPHLVKAVTLHRLRFDELDGRWHARVVLDV